MTRHELYVQPFLILFILISLVLSRRKLQTNCIWGLLWFLLPCRISSLYFRLCPKQLWVLWVQHKLQCKSLSVPKLFTLYRDDNKSPHCDSSTWTMLLSSCPMPKSRTTKMPSDSGNWLSVHRASEVPSYWPAEVPRLWCWNNRALSSSKTYWLPRAWEAQVSSPSSHRMPNLPRRKCYIYLL